MTGRQREQYATGTITRRSPIAETLAGGPVVEMNPEDMLRDGLAPPAPASLGPTPPGFGGGQCRCEPRPS